MKVLALSTAEQGAGLAIVDGSRLVCETFWDAKQTHSKRLLVMIEQLFEKRSDLALADIDAFVAARGPGSFTGLRIGISVVKGLSYALGKPTLGASSLDGIAFRFMYAALPVCVMMDAKRNEVYSAIYCFENGRLLSKTRETVGNPEKVIAQINGPAIFAGSGARVYKERIESQADHPIIAPSYQDSVSAVALIQSIGLQSENFNLWDYPLEPVYLRKSDAELSLLNSKN